MTIQWVARDEPSAPHGVLWELWMNGRKFGDLAKTSSGAFGCHDGVALLYCDTMREAARWLVESALISWSVSFDDYQRLSAALSRSLAALPETSSADPRCTWCDRPTDPRECVRSTDAASVKHRFHRGCWVKHVRFMNGGAP